MARKRHTHRAVHIHDRAPAPEPHPFPVPVDDLIGPSTAQGAATLVQRQQNTLTAPTCSAGQTSGRCERDSSTNSSLPIALGVVIPLVGAIVVFIFLHRRHVNKLKREEINDPHKSLDFGMDPAVNPSGKRKGKDRGGPETILPDEKGHRQGRGMSMEMGMGHPYLLPPELHNSRESLHSLSRSYHGTDDRYARGTTFIPGDNSSIRSFPTSPRKFPDNSSINTGSTGGGDGTKDNMKQELLKNAGSMSLSSPPKRNASLPRNDGSNPTSAETLEPVTPIIPRKNVPIATAEGGLHPPAMAEENRDSYIDRDGGDMRRSNNYLAGFINLRASSIDTDNHPSESHTDPPSLQQTEKRVSPPVINMPPSPPRPIRKDSANAPAFQAAQDDTQLDSDSDYGDAFNVTPPSPDRPSHPPIASTAKVDVAPAPANEHTATGLEAPNFDTRRLSLSIRPLPREDPSDSPEQRANRIRSFYKEYFDDSKPGPTENGGYYEDYDPGYLEQHQGDAAAILDSETGGFVVAKAPYAEPVTRRAMTPPPRAPPRFQSRGPHRGQQSMSGFMPPGPRAYSSASGRLGPAGRRPSKPLPPPSPLRVLPTPHLLREDAFALPIEFAPPPTYKDRAVGRPESPLGGYRPYSPAVPAHLPLASSFDELAAMPSPYALRKSGTFTALDFALPPRFKNSDTASDAGSIRSNRTGVSTNQLHSIRAGAYRVSRLPTDMVGTRDDLATSLRPTWSMRPHDS
ncbi:hypothetical protein FGG08_001173 [Glutinoglossum americanum]|uniref:Uncharacterized protein n=1 Tax=Glutinoglossum americanum TaxID=1670608 RepID=A0A9P8IBY9_9PEZI|nr:hypothetical protein FGG08_001173 [Glutinoglossum americanum]